MRKRCTSALILICLIGALLTQPISVLAQTPPSGGNTAIEKERLQFRTDVARWQVQSFLESQSIFVQGWQEAAGALAQLGGSIKLPDLSGQTSQVKALAEAVATATGDQQSKAAMEQLQAYIKTSQQGNQGRAKEMQQQVDASMGSLGEKIKKQVEDFLVQLKEKSKAEVQAQVEQYRQSLMPVGTKLTPEQQTAISQKVQQYAQNIGSQKQAANKIIVEAKIKEITQPFSDKVTKLGEAFKGMGAKMRAHFSKAQSEGKAFDERRRALILKAADTSISAVMERWNKISKEQQDQLGVKNLGTELSSARTQLEKDLAAALALSALTPTPPPAPASPTGNTTKPQGPTAPQPPPKPPAPTNLETVKNMIQQAVQAFTSRWQEIAKKVNQK